MYTILIDRKQALRFLVRFYEDVRRSQMTPLFDELAETIHDRRRFAGAFRRSIISRHAIDAPLESLSLVLSLACRHPTLTQALEYGHDDSAVLWMCKAIQRQLCSGQDRYNRTILEQGLTGIMYELILSFPFFRMLLTAHARILCSNIQVNTMTTVHTKTGVPLMPFVSCVALQSAHPTRGFYGFGAVPFDLNLIIS